MEVRQWAKQWGQGATDFPTKKELGGLSWVQESLIKTM